MCAQRAWGGNPTGRAASPSVRRSSIIIALKMPEGVFVFVSVVLVAGVPNELLFTAEVVYTRTVSCLASAGTAGTPAATDLVRGLLW